MIKKSVVQYPKAIAKPKPSTSPPHVTYIGLFCGLPDVDHRVLNPSERECEIAAGPPISTNPSIGRINMPAHIKKN